MGQRSDRRVDVEQSVGRCATLKRQRVADRSHRGGIVGAFWGSSSCDVWGLAGESILHWNGSAWSVFKSGSLGPLASPWGGASDDVWAVGQESLPGETPEPYSAIVHWDGREWSSSTVPPIDGGANPMSYGIWGSGRRTCGRSAVQSCTGTGPHGLP